MGQLNWTTMINVHLIQIQIPLMYYQGSDCPIYWRPCRVEAILWEIRKFYLLAPVHIGHVYRWSAIFLQEIESDQSSIWRPACLSEDRSIIRNAHHVITILVGYIHAIVSDDGDLAPIG